MRTRYSTVCTLLLDYRLCSINKDSFLKTAMFDITNNITKFLALSHN